MSDQLKLGVFGGSFNPIHTGHLIIAQNVLTELGLDRVLFVTSNQNPFKIEQMNLNYEERVRLVEKAIDSNPNFFHERFETGDRPSYTVDTIRYLKEKYPKAQMYFICGIDNIMELHLWKDFEELAKLCHFAFVNRNDLAYHYIEAQEEFLRCSYQASLIEVKAPMIQISATWIRNRISEKKSVQYLVPECILEEVNRLYGLLLSNPRE